MHAPGYRKEKAWRELNFGELISLCLTERNTHFYKRKMPTQRNNIKILLPQVGNTAVLRSPPAISQMPGGRSSSFTFLFFHFESIENNIILAIS